MKGDQQQGRGGPEASARNAREAGEPDGRLTVEPTPEGELHRVVLDGMGEALFVTDARDYRIILCNRPFLAEYGLERDEVIGRTCYQVTRLEDLPCAPDLHRCPNRLALANGRPVVREVCFPAADGARTCIEYTTRPVADGQGLTRWLLHTERDISELKLAEDRLTETNAELTRANAFLRDLIMSSVDAVIAADMTGRIMIFNRAAGTITGYTEAEALNDIDIRDIYPGDGARKVMARLRSGGNGAKGRLRSEEVELQAKDGSRVPISLSASIVYEDGREAATVGFFYDLREMRAMENELDKTRIQLMQAEKMASMGKLAAGVAHQLNNPLGGITIFGHLLLEEYKLQEEARADVTRILEDAERCQTIVKELLQFARQTDNAARPFDINEILTRTIFLLESQPVFYNVTLIRDLAENLPPVTGDDHQFSQVFMNIILNAAEAMDGQGWLAFRTSLTADGQRVRILISDTGPGIPDSVLPMIFDPFFTTKEPGKGTGLGLSVAFGIIENHLGTISARNRAEGGAEFTIELPVFRDPDAE